MGALGDEDEEPAKGRRVSMGRRDERFTYICCRRACWLSGPNEFSSFDIVRRAYSRGKSGRMIRSRNETSATARTSMGDGDDGKSKLAVEPLPFWVDVGEDGR